MISHETKRILGTTGVLLIVALLVARALPFPVPSSTTVTRAPFTVHRLPPTLIFSHNLSLLFGARSFNMSLTGGHQYMWRFNVTHGSMMINLTSPATHLFDWSVGPHSSGSQYLNGTGAASFNWTAPVSGFYLLTFQSVSPWQWVGLFGTSVCNVNIWDLDTVEPSFIFQTKAALTMAPAVVG